MRACVHTPAALDPAVPVGDGEAAAHLMARVPTEVRALLLQKRQNQRKAKLDAHRWDVRFAEGDEVLLDPLIRAGPNALAAGPARLGRVERAGRPDQGAPGPSKGSVGRYRSA
jgi:hypothetical protein